MAECINCGSETFETVGDDAVITNLISDIIGIEQGDTLRVALFKVASKLEEVLSSQGTVSAEGDIGEITIDKPLTGKSKESFTLQVSPATSSTTISYDIVDAIGGSGVTAFVKVRAFGTSGGTVSKVFDSSLKATSFTANPENFPLNLDIEATVVDGQAQSLYKFSKTIENLTAISDYFMDVTDLSSAEISTQKDVNELFDQNIGALNNRVKSLEA